MKFPDRDRMSEEEIARNASARQDLIRGRHYRFVPPVKATAIPTAGPGVCALAECEFARGWYIGFVDGQHVFQGKPVNDSRAISVPGAAPDPDALEEQLRESYFHVLFIGGSQAILDPDQSN